MSESFTVRFHDWFQALLHDTWNWFDHLNFQEWLLLLGIVAALGFFCMRGYASRGRI